MSQATGPRAPARNRVSPLGEIIAAPGRGTWMGNRGRLHDGRGTREVVRNHQTRAWITCRLSFWNRRAAQWEPGHYTPLFFLDEAVALAAGHRPCAECRRPAYTQFRGLVAEGLGASRLLAPELDRLLHEERWDARHRSRRLHTAHWPELPAGSFVLIDSGPALVEDDHLTLWRPDNRYGEKVPRPRTGTATLVTPPSTVAALRRGYPAQRGGPSAQAEVLE
ncbi:MAG TPA: hypothetical protein VJN29_15040 [Intrasporangium sp.]|uniref:hypothetical protein n=1 Tax=Intrasporangium sp. TaxID=1925024 RepID=UPI002B49964E|nr:hypothetical protein [Intrasporangium sp.]HKX68531.1 hypothetical protein [Intrasporangium sp.]